MTSSQILFIMDCGSSVGKRLNIRPLTKEEEQLYGKAYTHYISEQLERTKPMPTRNKKNISHPITPYNVEYTQSELVGKHPAELRQMYLDSHNMSYLAQCRIHNDCEGTISNWFYNLNP